MACRLLPRNLSSRYETHSILWAKGISSFFDCLLSHLVVSGNFSYAAPKANSTESVVTYVKVQTILLDSTYNPLSGAVTAIFVHTLEDSRVSHVSKTRGQLACLIDGANTTGSLFDDPHRHTQILRCTVPLRSRRQPRINVTFVDRGFPQAGSIQVNMSTLDSLLRPHHVLRKSLVSCSSPLYERGRFLPEWIEYHHLLGVEHFYVYGWGADRTLQEAVRRYAELGIATFVNWTLPIPPNGLHYQPQAQNHCLYNFGQTAEYVCIVWFSFADFAAAGLCSTTLMNFLWSKMPRMLLLFLLCCPKSTPQVPTAPFALPASQAAKFRLGIRTEAMTETMLLIL